MRTWFSIFSRFVWGAYLVLVSVYALLAFLPYTYEAVIKAPPYEWVVWFVRHQVVLYFAALSLVIFADWLKGWTRTASVLYAALIAAGAYTAFRPFLPGLQDDWAAYGWSLAPLILSIVVCGRTAYEFWRKSERKSDTALLPYSTAVLAAVVITLLYGLSTEIHRYAETRSVQFGLRQIEILGWSLGSHVLLAILVLSGINLIRMATRRTANSGRWNFAALLLVSVIVLTVLLTRFMGSAFSFEGWAVELYGSVLAVSLALWTSALALPLASSQGAKPIFRGRRLALGCVMVLISCAAIALPTIIGGGDWNGILQKTFTLAVWIVLTVLFFRLRPRRVAYSIQGILAVVFFSAFTYKALQATEVFWAKPLGETDDEVSRSLENYAVQDASFQMVHNFLGNSREEDCGDLCRILRENTNVREATAQTDLQLVDRLVASPGVHPNIFIFVIDSLRQDYVGAYNRQVDFTPNLDAFARDSIVVHNAYTQYAGTSLSEPAIWAGTLLLHAHYLQPFKRVNSLEKLARADGYRMIVSYDEILQQILGPSPDTVKLDTDKKLWNQFDVCSTIQQAEDVLHSSAGDTRPVLFYAQPKNVHQFARTTLPSIADDHWRMRADFNNRIAHEVFQVDGCLGKFYEFLRAKGMYDNSIIIVTSDHGDATGELGRYSHSFLIFPEIMRVPLLVHLPATMRREVVYDDTHLSSLIDITPSLYYLLRHRGIRAEPLFGHPLFVADRKELVERNELFFASDERAVYGWLTENGRFLYTTYDSPAQSFLFDLSRDRDAQHNILTAQEKLIFDKKIIDELHTIADFYGFKPGIGSLLTARQ